MNGDPLRLFDPAEFGVTERPARRRSKPTPPPVVTVGDGWTVLQRLDLPAIAHRLGHAATTNTWGSVLAQCGAHGTTMTVDVGEVVPACRKCVAFAATCPACGAGVDEPCASIHGVAYADRRVHPDRRRAVDGGAVVNE